MTYNFDDVIERRHTDSVKWNGNYNDDPKMIKMWVADMDFQTAPEITAALTRRVQEGIYGYGMIDKSYHQAVVDYMARHHQLYLKKDWLEIFPGVVSALRVLIHALTMADDAIMIMTPVYYPFGDSIDYTGRKKVLCPLTYHDGRYTLDDRLFEQLIIAHEVKLLIFCNPHNPIGKVWQKEELKTIGMICRRHNVLIISDEIHMDFVYAPYRHVPFYNVDESFKDFTIIATAASKTFNLAGLQCSNIIIANDALHQKVKETMRSLGYGMTNLLGPLATQIAYTQGDAWRHEMLRYVKANIDYMDQYMKTYIPELKVVNPEGLYLVWVDCSALGMDASTQERFMLEQAHLWLDEGILFGQDGSAFERFNVACPRATLCQALTQLKEAVDAWRNEA